MSETGLRRYHARVSAILTNDVFYHRHHHHHAWRSRRGPLRHSNIMAAPNSTPLQPRSTSVSTCDLEGDVKADFTTFNPRISPRKRLRSFIISYELEIFPRWGHIFHKANSKPIQNVDRCHNFLTLSDLEWSKRAKLELVDFSLTFEVIQVNDNGSNENRQWQRAKTKAYDDHNSYMHILIAKQTYWILQQAYYQEYVKSQANHFTEYWICQQFNLYFLLNTWQKPMTQEVCPTFSHGLGGQRSRPEDEDEGQGPPSGQG